eukprot:2479345-Rhodomonas_salina.2
MHRNQHSSHPAHFIHVLVDPQKWDSQSSLQTCTCRPVQYNFILFTLLKVQKDSKYSFDGTGCLAR